MDKKLLGKFGFGGKELELKLEEEDLLMITTTGPGAEYSEGLFGLYKKHSMIDDEPVYKQLHTYGNGYYFYSGPNYWIIEKTLKYSKAFSQDWKYNNGANYNYNHNGFVYRDAQFVPIMGYKD